MLIRTSIFNYRTDAAQVRSVHCSLLWHDPIWRWGKSRRVSHLVTFTVLLSLLSVHDTSYCSGAGFLLQTSFCQQLGVKSSGVVPPMGHEDVGDLQPQWAKPGLHRGWMAKWKEQDRMTFFTHSPKKNLCDRDLCNCTKVSKLLSVTLWYVTLVLFLIIAAPVRTCC